MRRGFIDLITLLYTIVTVIIAPMLGAMIEKSNDNIITKSIGYENNETKVYPKIIIDD